jgi:hypothetical protein
VKKEGREEKERDGEGEGGRERGRVREDIRNCQMRMSVEEDAF